MPPTKSPFDDVEFPPLSALPFKAGDPPGAIWGFYESLAGTPESPDEIAGYQRKTFEHRVFKPPGKKVDDEIYMNTQSGSQWDSFRHWGYYKTKQYYNRLPESEIVNEQGESIALSVDKPLRNGIHTFQGKIVGRGVLLDYFSYAQSQGVRYAPEHQHLVTAEDLDACAKVQGVKFHQGDILFVRMGYIFWYEHATPEERADVVSGQTRAVGVRQTEAEVEWLWNHHFAAVASDTPAFEARPSTQEWNLHDYLLALWGVCSDLILFLTH